MADAPAGAAPSDAEQVADAPAGAAPSEAEQMADAPANASGGRSTAELLAAGLSRRAILREQMADPSRWGARGYHPHRSFLIRDDAFTLKKKF